MQLLWTSIRYEIRLQVHGPSGNESWDMKGWVYQLNLPTDGGRHVSLWSKNSDESSIMCLGAGEYCLGKLHKW